MMFVEEGETTVCIGGLPLSLTQEDVRGMAGRLSEFVMLMVL